MKRFARSTISVEVGCLLALSACNGSPPAPAAGPTPQLSVASTAPASSAPAPPASVVGRGPWQAAGAGDDIALRRLAAMHGGLGLLAVVRSSGPRAAIALRALPSADDAELALGELAVRARQQASSRRPMLRAILDIASKQPQPSEPLAPDSVARCVSELDALSRDGSVERLDRALAVSALRALARAGKADREAITGELDP